MSQVPHPVLLKGGSSAPALLCTQMKAHSANILLLCLHCMLSKSPALPMRSSHFDSI